MRLIFLYHRPSLITKRRNSSKGSSTLSHFHCYNFRGTDEILEKVDIPLPQAKSDNKEEEQFKRFFYSCLTFIVIISEVPVRYQRRLIFLYHRPSLITKRRNSSKGSSTLSHFHCYNFRGTDEVSEKVDIPLPQAKSDNKEEEQFKRFFYSVSGEVILQRLFYYYGYEKCYSKSQVL